MEFCGENYNFRTSISCYTRFIQDAVNEFGRGDEGLPKVAFYEVG